ncbi:MAG: response regulator receiver protein [Gemmatimonadetes bacterium]|jgi:CheY-like chemotaxis protein|nr:response regulator receiver protein [Gemmatimonadota bacterium]
MPMKILIADDDRVIAQLVAAVVRDAGHTPLHAYDAMQTVMFAMRVPAPDLVILDINMPGGTGLDALRKLKMSAKTGHIPVVVLSGSIDQSLPTKVKELGAAGFLTKPIDPDMLAEAIRSATA